MHSYLNFKSLQETVDFHTFGAEKLKDELISLR